MMGAMAPSEPLTPPPGYDRAPGPPSCGECGAAIGNVELHTAWHAGSDQADLRGEILGFLDSVDPAALSMAALERDDHDDPIAAALAILKEQAANLP